MTTSPPCAPAGSRSEARTTGNARYMGLACKHGHAPVRYTSSAMCVECDRLRHASGLTATPTWKQRNPERVRQQQRLYRARIAFDKQEGRQRPGRPTGSSSMTVAAAMRQRRTRATPTACRITSHFLTGATSQRLQALYQAVQRQGGRVTRVTAKAAIQRLRLQGGVCDECMADTDLKLCLIEPTVVSGLRISNLHWICACCEKALDSDDDL